MKRTTILIIIIFLINFSIVYADNETEIRYYGVSSCSDCEMVVKYLQKIKNEYKKEVNIIYKDISNEEAKKEYLILIEELDLFKAVPMLLINNKAIYGVDNIKDDLKKKIKNNEGTNNSIIDNLEKDVDKIIRKDFKNLSLLTVFLSGFIDGFNPCAMSMLIFFLMYVLTLKDKKKNIFSIGIAFILGTFITYYGIGIGLLKFLLDINSLVILKIIYLVAIILCLVFMYLNIYDYIKLKKDNIKKVKNQLPRKIKHVIQNIIRENLNKKHLILVSFILGMLISVLEFSCTGQMYIPTLSYIMGLDNTTDKIFANTYLLIYNLAFIIPLAAILYLINKNENIIKISNMLLKNERYIKLITAIIYLVFILFLGNRFLNII